MPPNDTPNDHGVAWPRNDDERKRELSVKVAECGQCVAGCIAIATSLHVPVPPAVIGAASELANWSAQLQEGPQ